MLRFFFAAIIVCFTLFLEVTHWFFPSWCGSHSLGNNLYLLDWDFNQQILVYGCAFEGRACISGPNLIREYNLLYHGSYDWESIVSVENNDTCLIVKTRTTDSLLSEFSYVIEKGYDDKITEYDDIVKSYMTKDTIQSY